MGLIAPRKRKEISRAVRALLLPPLFFLYLLEGENGGKTELNLTEPIRCHVANLLFRTCDRQKERQAKRDRQADGNFHHFFLVICQPVGLELWSGAEREEEEEEGKEFKNVG